jgi:hypothetical protein
MSRSSLGRYWAYLPAVAIAVAALAVPTAAQADPSEVAPKHVLKNIEQANADGKPDTPSGDAGKPGGGGGPLKTNGINYHGGPVMVTTTNAYVIWYGAWPSSAANSTPSLVSTFLTNVGGSPYFNVNTTYYNGSNVHVSNSVALAGTAFDPDESRGNRLSDTDVQSVVARAITNGLTKDANGVYFVLTSSDVTETSGFLTQYCGWHTHGTINGADIKYAFVGDASAKLSACAAESSSSPNGNPAGDAMISVIAHELEESVTDPDLNAWYDTRGYENADKCAWTFGTTHLAANGSLTNMNIGGLDFLIQRNWVNASGGLCSLSYP